MESFVCHQNIERYRKLLEVARDETQRREIVALLAKEEDELKRLNLKKTAGAESARS